MANDVEDIVRKLVAKHFDLPLGEVDLDMPITDAPDSLKLSELIVALEQHFDVALEDSAVAQARVLRDLVTLVEARLASARGR
jgi:acyl carrier protein